MNLLALVSRATWTLGGLVFLTGCGTMSNGRGWGQDVDMLPSPTHVGHAAWNALTDPWTWVPIAGALVLQIEDFDERISDWAQDDAPMFGSSEDAKSARGWTGNASDFIYFSSVAVTPSGDEPLDWAWSKAKGLSVQMSARFVTLWSGDIIKDASGRERPVGEDTDSFPSQHASGMAVNARLTCDNLRAIQMPTSLRYVLNGGVIGLAAAGSWSRVEAGGHFPSDVLAGVALGNFLGRFFDEAFLGLAEEGVYVQPVPTADSFGIAVSFRF